MAVSIACPNCSTPNPEAVRVCHACGAMVPRLLLYALGEGATAVPAGQRLGDRYWSLGQGVFLEGRPDLVPDATGDPAKEWLPYLKLSPQQPQVPSVYGFWRVSGSAPWTFLESAAIDPQGQVLPRLVDVWAQAQPIQQLHWLWQLACLWSPLSEVGVASTLGDRAAVRVEGSWLRLLYLRADGDRPVTLREWGRQMWAVMLPVAAVTGGGPELAMIYRELSFGEIDAADRLRSRLETVIDAYGAAYRVERPRFELATLSDPGPTRSRNEDACWPPHETQARLEPGEPAWVVVCDGLGGHQGGNVASALAIEVIHDHLEPFVQNLRHDRPTPQQIAITLERAIRAANQAIEVRNNQESREERQRMGTTVVLALAIDHWLYLAWVGDSRAYCLTRSSGHQVTLDDDLATRDARLGFGFYRDLLQMSAAGALTQALGMGSSEYLAPTVRRFLLTEDAVWLLCSDGVSDFDLVSAIAPDLVRDLLYEGRSLAEVAQEAIALANQRNGHDNSTVALLRVSMPSLGTPSPADRPAHQIATESPLVQPTRLSSAQVGQSTSEPIAPDSLAKAQAKPVPGKPSARQTKGHHHQSSHSENQQVENSSTQISGFPETQARQLANQVNTSTSQIDAARADLASRPQHQPIDRPSLDPLPTEATPTTTPTLLVDRSTDQAKARDDRSPEPGPASPVPGLGGRSRLGRPLGWWLTLGTIGTLAVGGVIVSLGPWLQTLIEANRSGQSTPSTAPASPESTAPATALPAPVSPPSTTRQTVPLQPTIAPSWRPGTIARWSGPTNLMLYGRPSTPSPPGLPSLPSAVPHALPPISPANAPSLPPGRTPQPEAVILPGSSLKIQTIPPGPKPDPSASGTDLPANATNVPKDSLSVIVCGLPPNLPDPLPAKLVRPGQQGLIKTADLGDRLKALESTAIDEETRGVCDLP